MFFASLIGLALLGQVFAGALPQEVADLFEKRTVSSSDPVQIKSITIDGTGCMPGSYSQNIASDGTAFTLTFSEFTASIGPGISASENQKSCHIKLGLHNPGGYQYSILTATYRGYIAIGESVTATLKNSYCFAGQKGTKNTKHSFTGAQQMEYVKADDVLYKTTVWSPCGKDATLDIKSTICLKSTDPTDQGFMVVDSVEGEFVQKYHMAWRKCIS